MIQKRIMLTVTCENWEDQTSIKWASLPDISLITQLNPSRSVTLLRPILYKQAIASLKTSLQYKMLSKNVLATLSLALASGVMANPPHGQPACCSNSKGICASGTLLPAGSILQRGETQLTIWPCYSLVHYYSGPTVCVHHR